MCETSGERHARRCHPMTWAEQVAPKRAGQQTLAAVASKWCDLDLPDRAIAERRPEPSHSTGVAARAIEARPALCWARQMCGSD
jgi:hypothetical protein